jgi:hypothetical protein
MAPTIWLEFKHTCNIAFGESGTKKKKKRKEKK